MPVDQGFIHLIGLRLHIHHVAVGGAGKDYLSAVFGIILDDRLLIVVPVGNCLHDIPAFGIQGFLADGPAAGLLAVRDPLDKIIAAVLFNAPVLRRDCNVAIDEGIKALHRIIQVLIIRTDPGLHISALAGRQVEAGFTRVDRLVHVLKNGVFIWLVALHFGGNLESIVHLPDDTGILRLRNIGFMEFRQ